MTVQTVDPIQDSRWRELVRAHPAATVFHTPGWLQALHRTYGYQPVLYTTCPPNSALTNGIVVCRVRSWLTGNRLISVPFADHCDPLGDTPPNTDALLTSLREEVAARWTHVELRPTTAAQWLASGFQPGALFRLHAIDLRPSLEDLYRNTHGSAIRRKIRRAEREGLRYEDGQSDRLLNAFYRLLVLTRRRHGVPPPPRQWFKNLMDLLGQALNIRLVSLNGRPIGSIITLRHRKTLVYKYGASDAAFHSLGAMPLLFWRAIEDAKALGLDTFDLGRSDCDNLGLITFKERLGGVASDLRYLRCYARPVRTQGPLTRRSSRLFAWLPEPLAVIAGRILYRHMA